LCNAAIAGFVDFEEIFKRLAATKFRMADTIVRDLREKFNRHQ